MMSKILYLAVTILIVFQIQCDEISDYEFTFKTGVGPGAGTDCVFNITLVSSFNQEVTFALNGSEQNYLEQSSKNVLRYRGKLVYPVDKMIIQRTSKIGWYPDWYLHYVTLDVNSSFYVFKINRWIREDKPYRFYSLLSDCHKGYMRIQQCRKET